MENESKKQVEKVDNSDEKFKQNIYIYDKVFTYMENDKLKKFIKTTIREFLNENQKYDDKVGKEFWFEYHCYEGHDSCDAEIWYRSHQKVKVIGVSEWSHDDLQDRIEDATPRVYKIRFEDGFEYDAWEDEIVDSPDEFYRPKPPKRG